LLGRFRTPDIDIRGHPANGFGRSDPPRDADFRRQRLSAGYALGHRCVIAHSAHPRGRNCGRLGSTRR
jgi:hypothetical protein